MIELADAYGEIEIGGQKVPVLKFNCEFCGQPFNRFSFNISVFLYGIAFLFGKEFSYAGVTCPKCFSTILMKGDTLIGLQQDIDILPYFINQNDNYENPASIRYHASIINMPAQTESLIQFKTFYWTGPLTGDSEEYFDSNIATYLEETQDLEQDYICSYKTGGNPPIGAVATVWWFKPEQIEKIVEIENKEEIRIFPRHVHKMEWYERYEKFCWQYKYHLDHMAEMRESASNSFNLLRDAARRENINLDNLLDDPDLLTNEKVDFIEQQAQQTAAKDIYVVSEFLDLLINYNPTLSHIPRDTSSDEDTSCDITWQISDSYECFWKSVMPFKETSIPGKIDEFDPKLYSPKITDAIVEEMADNVRANYTKSHVQEWAMENHQKFIEEYISLARQSDFSYGLVWDLKCRYLQQLHAILDKKLLKDAKYAFYAEGPTWTIIFNGKALRGLKGNGFRYIQYLVMNPKKHCYTVDLSNIDGMQKNTIPFSDEKDYKNINRARREPKIDPEALIACDNRINEIKEEIAETKKISDKTTHDKLIEELDKLESYKEKNCDQIGKLQYQGYSDPTKVRIAQSIRRAIENIKKHDPEIANHFQKALQPINTNLQGYYPAEEIDWQFKD